jgi:hypothetical protein
MFISFPIPECSFALGLRSTKAVTSDEVGELPAVGTGTGVQKASVPPTRDWEDRALKN